MDVDIIMEHFKELAKPGEAITASHDASGNICIRMTYEHYFATYTISIMDLIAASTPKQVIEWSVEQCLNMLRGEQE